METLKIGETYNVSHSRKGKFKMKISSISDEWITGVIVEGTAGAILDYNIRGEGEEIEIRKSMSKFFKA